MDISYRTARAEDWPALAALIQGLYHEDPSDQQVTPQKIARTFAALAERPERGSIIAFAQGNDIVGYALLINFWSNEFGGNIVYIDELYVVASHRSQGVGSRFVKHLAANMPADAVALRLEVTPGNSKARALYERLGFRSHKNDTLSLLIQK